MTACALAACQLYPHTHDYMIFTHCGDESGHLRMLEAQLIQMMPYTRTEETAKNKTVYRKFSVWAGVSLTIQGLLPIGIYFYYLHEKIDWQMFVFLPAIVMYFLYLLIWKRLHGYTGDCCGALFLLTELSVYLIATYYLA